MLKILRFKPIGTYLGTYFVLDYVSMLKYSHTMKINKKNNQPFSTIL